VTSAAPAPDPAGRLWLPSFGLGCAPIGDLYERVTDEQAVATVHRALELGIRLFDTAPRYGAGLAERRLGLALRGVDRAGLMIATKVGWLLDDDGTARADFSADGVARSLEASLRRLGLDAVDLVHVHDPDDHMREALTEAIPALCKLRDEGVIRAIGAGMNSSTALAQLVAGTGIDAVLIAGRYTLLEQPALADLLPACADNSVDVIAAGVFNSGLLADPRPAAPYNYAPAPEQTLARTLRLQEICLRHGVPLKAAALRFPLGHPAVRSVVVGAVTPDEVAENARLRETDIPSALWEDLVAAELLVPEAPKP
jgi:D-threo-aldose 1-dehydrogenase